jgi:predicted PurR-regulated permease PerM
VLVGLVLFGLVVLAVVTGVQGSLPELRSSVDEGIGQLQTFITNGPFPVTDAQLDSARESAVNVLTGAGVRSGALAGASLVGQVLTGVVLALIVLIYLLKDGPSIYAFLISGSKGNRHTRLQHVGERSVDVLGGYVRGTTVVALFDGVVIGGALLVLGVPLAVPLALVTFIAAFIPVIGAVVAGVIAALVTLVTQGPVDALIIVVVVLLVNQLEGNLVSPLVLGKALSLHPLAILLALTAGTIVAGVVGALLSVPVAAVAWAAVKSWNADKRATTAALTRPAGDPASPAPPVTAG